MLNFKVKEKLQNINPETFENNFSKISFMTFIIALESFIYFSIDYSMYENHNLYHFFFALLSSGTIIYAFTIPDDHRQILKSIYAKNKVNCFFILFAALMALSTMFFSIKTLIGIL